MVREKSDFRERLNRTKTIFRRNRIDALCAVRFQRPLVVPIVSLWSFTVLFFAMMQKKTTKTNARRFIKTSHGSS